MKIQDSKIVALIASEKMIREKYGESYLSGHMINDTLWFRSAKEAAEVCNPQMTNLLQVIASEAPRTLEELARLLELPSQEVEARLRKLEGYGVVELAPTQDGIRPYARGVGFSLHTLPGDNALTPVKYSS